MALDSTHPQYDAHVDEWVQMRDLYKGETAVKAKGVEYMPATSGMLLDGMNSGDIGFQAYEAYLKRAVFPDYVREGVEALVGLLHQKAPNIELPAALEPLREKATVHGEPLEALLRRINEEQLVTGRLGLLLDLPSGTVGPETLPYIAMYAAEAVRNWDDGEAGEGVTNLDFVMLDESGYIRKQDFEWEALTKYRLLLLGYEEGEDGEPVTTDPVYRVGVFENVGGGKPEYNPTQIMTPVFRGAPLDEIPFVFVNTKDIVSEPDIPPLMGLGRLCLAIYRGEADYRQNLYMQGQDTLVVIGGTNDPDAAPGEDGALRTGAGSRIDVDLGGDAKYIGVTSQGLSEQRQAIEGDRKRAEMKAAQLISTQNNQESGEALKTRIAAQTATLNQIAKAGAEGLANLLRKAAKWIGANPDEVKVEPNLEFADFNLSGQEIVHLMTARSMGAPLSKESIHALMFERGITKLDYETEIDKIEEEDASAGLPTVPGSGTNLPPVDSDEEEQEEEEEQQDE